MKKNEMVVRMGERRGSYRVLVVRPEGKRPLQDIALDGRIILKSIFKKWDGEVWTGLMWLRDRWRARVNAVMHLWVP
jgi:hypothetical protein